MTEAAEKRNDPYQVGDSDTYRNVPPSEPDKADNMAADDTIDTRPPFITRSPSVIPAKRLQNYSDESATDYSMPEEEHPKLVIWTKKPVFRTNFRSLQGWEGLVKSVDEQRFFATVYDLTGETGASEAEIPLDDVQSYDLELVRPGAVFYWYIGYHEDVNGTRRRASDIRFRRLPRWRARDIVAAQDEAHKLRALLE
jgi:hypothetical protein